MKKAHDKAKGGLLVINASDADGLASQNVNFAAAAQRGGVYGAKAPHTSRIPARLTDAFTRKHGKGDDGFGLFMLAMLTVENSARMSKPTLDCC